MDQRIGDGPARGARGTATIEEVAARAGVSRSTVSRVLGGGARVSPEALTAVRQAIAELNYVPNRAARSLASRQTHAIALVVPEDTTRFFGDPFFAAIVSGINARLSRSEHVLNLIIASDDPGDKATSYLTGGNVDGALVVSHHTSDTYVERINQAVPVVFGGRPVRTRADDYFVDIDNVEGGRIGTRHLVERGHRRIGTITGPLDMPAGVDRLQGFREVLEEAGLEPGPAEDGDFTTDGGAEAMRRILAAGDPPDALFVASDLMARGAIGVLHARGLRVPEDVAIVGFDDSPVAVNMPPHLTTVRQPSRLQGEAMADVLLARLAGGDPPHATILQSELVVRETA
ncbi:substrate-binding domain-containing protein [Microbacterium sp. MEC084]|uniref:LacI family DNA-binding transcriptional regulator n=1 Tax=unclassified Microbacterium TaxID=2609290 RepID=UPI000701C0FF|nr:MULTISPECIES: LacI family DNA-binding transcriptional regulator [unclassified Microbacterium]KQZ11960.1 LacI family transcriptional regulator [Microbacterium sp. Root53]MCD1267872.1 substrate-binding domain-containing protein [Microbacterium sp. MEC084]